MHKNRRRSPTPKPPYYVNNDVYDASSPKGGGPPGVPRSKLSVTWGRFEAGRPVLRRPPSAVAAPSPQYDVKAQYVPRQRSQAKF